MRKIERTIQVSKNYEGTQEKEWTRKVDLTIIIDGKADEDAWDELAIDAAVIKAQGRLRKQGRDGASAMTFRPGEVVTRVAPTPEQVLSKLSNEQLMELLKARGINV